MTAAGTSVLISGGHRWHEEFLLGYGTIAGLLYLVGAVPIPRMIADLPGPTGLAWAAVLLASGIIGVIGCWVRGPRGMLFELAGLLMAGGALLLLAAVGLLGAPGVGLVAVVQVGLIAAWASANLATATQLLSQLREIARAQR